MASESNKNMYDKKLLVNPAMSLVTQSDTCISYTLQNPVGYCMGPANEMKQL